MTPQALRSSFVEVEDSLEAVNDYYHGQGWTDGLPIVPPTEDRVRRMLDHLGRDPAEIVALIPPRNDEATIEKIAINAVMAGCRPEYLPVIIAQIEAVSESEYNLEAVQATTNPVAPLTIVNGPIRHALQVNGGSNAAGNGWQANATIGRALRLILVNIGGAVPGPVDKATIGWPGKFTFCVAENEEESPWEPLHVERGLASSQSAVTMAHAAGYHEVRSGYSGPEEWLYHVVSSLVPTASSTWDTKTQPTILMCPAHAQVLAKAGYDKKRIREALYERTFVPVSAFRPEYLRSLLSRPHPVRQIVRESYPLLTGPDALTIAVVGGPGGIHTAVIHPSGATWSVTKPVALPEGPTAEAQRTQRWN